MALLALLAPSCSRQTSGGSSTARQGSGELLIAAAADLAALQDRLTEGFAQAHGRKAEMVFGSSGILARQIEQGAPYDVYLSANEGYVWSLAEAGKVDRDSIRVYATGRLGIWSRTGTILKLEDLTSELVLHVAAPNPAHAPYGVAAREALRNIGVWDDVEPKIVYGENVRQALQFAESGNAEAALTAWSLVVRNGGVLVPPELHPPIRQSGAVVRSTRHAALARKFIEFLTGPHGQRILTENGFGPPQ